MTLENAQPSLDREKHHHQWEYGEGLQNKDIPKELSKLQKYMRMPSLTTDMQETTIYWRPIPKPAMDNKK